MEPKLENGKPVARQLPVRRVTPNIIKDLLPDKTPSDEMLKLSTFLKEYVVWGKAEIVVKNGKPVFITHMLRDIKLTVD